MVVAAGQNGFVEGKIGENVDVALVGENALCMLPIREMGVKGQRNKAMHGLECL